MENEFRSPFRDWDHFYMSLAYFVAMKSKDESSKIGAVIVGRDNEPRSFGFNGLCRNVDENPAERHERPTKYLWYEHAERNSLYNSNRSATGVSGCRMYTQHTPCMDCARGIIQSGIAEVIVHADAGNSLKSNIHWRESRKMLEEAGVKVREWQGEIVREIWGLFSGQRF